MKNDLLAGELVHLTAENPEVMAEVLFTLEPGYGMVALIGYRSTQAALREKVEGMAGKGPGKRCNE